MPRDRPFEKKWMFLHRCRVCGTYWAEACYDRWQVMFYYLFPAPATDDPIRWLNEEAEELPARCARYKSEKQIFNFPPDAISERLMTSELDKYCCSRS